MAIALRLCVVFFVGCLFVPSAVAGKRIETAIQELKQQSKSQSGPWLLVLKGGGTAYGYANSYLRSKKLEPIYCTPANLTLNHLNFADIVIEEYSRDPVAYNDPDFLDSATEVFSLALLNGLQRTFPCH